MTPKSTRAMTLLSILRGPDGQRLSLVVAVMLALAGFIGGINSGQAAVNGGLSILCATDETGNPALPAGQNHDQCCLAGHGPSAGPAPSAAPAVVIVFVATAETAVAAASHIVVPLARASEGPRGPPLAG